MDEANKQLLDEVNNLTDKTLQRIAIERVSRKPPSLRVRAVIHLDNRKPSIDDNPIEDSSVRTTNQEYFLEYIPVYYHKCENKGKKKKPYMMRCDLIDTKNFESIFKFDDPEYILDSEDPWVKWVLEYTSLSRATFITAKANPYLAVRFSIDWGKLARAQHGHEFIIKCEGGKEDANT